MHYMNVVLQAIVGNKLLYASPADRHRTRASADDRHRLDGFLRWSAKFASTSCATSTAFVDCYGSLTFIMKTMCSKYDRHHQFLGLNHYPWVSTAHRATSHHLTLVFCLFAPCVQITVELEPLIYIICPRGLPRRCVPFM